MATLSCILAWKIPWGLSGKLQSRRSQRIGHNWTTEHECTKAFLQPCFQMLDFFFFFFLICGKWHRREVSADFLFLWVNSNVLSYM